MEETVTIKEIIDILKREGWGLTRDQLWAYIEKDIVPHPVMLNQGKNVSGCYPADMLVPLRKFLALRDQGIPLRKAKEILLEENLHFVSEFLRKRGMNLEKLHHFALPNIEVNECGAIRMDRGFSQFFIDLLETTLWRGEEKRKEQALQILQRQLLKWKASLEAFWQKFDKIEVGDSWKGKRSKITQAYVEAITTLSGTTPGASPAP